MPLGNGYWYNRRSKRYLAIDDHAKDACSNPKRFGLTDRDLIKAIREGDKTFPVHPHQGHAVVRHEADRDLIIPRVCQAGFIRIRHWKDSLGWQFAGDPENALETLRCYGKKHEVGIATNVTFTDFGLGVSITDQFVQFHTGSVSLTGLIESWISRYEQTDKSAK